MQPPSPPVRRSFVSRFHALLVRGSFASRVPDISLGDILLKVPDVVLRQLAHSVLSEDDLSDERAVFAASTELNRFQFTFDSASEIHLLTLPAATALFSNKQVSNLRVLGVSGVSTCADLMGHLIIAVLDPVTDLRYHIDLGLSHGMASCR